MIGDDPDWLRWSREIQATAQSGLAFTRDPYDRERYEALRLLAARMMGAGSGQDAAVLLDLFTAQAGYATPKVDVRGAVFDAEGRLLLVRETIDAGRWTLPGGWADVNQTPSECVLREIAEETGYAARVRKLALLHDAARQGHPAGPFSIYKLFFLCALCGGEAAASLETSEASFFAEQEIPADLSTGRTLPHQIARLFAHHKAPNLPTEFD